MCKRIRTCIPVLRSSVSFRKISCFSRASSLKVRKTRVSVPRRSNMVRIIRGTCTYVRSYYVRCTHKSYIPIRITYAYTYKYYLHVGMSSYVYPVDTSQTQNDDVIQHRSCISSTNLYLPTYLLVRRPR